jgi:endonuclease YncB( thermonuclease family)
MASAAKIRHQAIRPVLHHGLLPSWPFQPQRFRPLYQTVRPIEGIAQVLDGDTIQIRTQRIRLLGIDAFEAEAAGFRRARAGGLMALR